MSEEIPSAGPLPTEDLEDLYENAPCGYLSIEPSGRIFKVNTTLCTWLGYQASELAGKRLQDVLNIAGRIFYETHFAPLLRMQGFFNEVALDLMTRQGARLPVLVNATEHRDAAGGHISTRLTVFNATDRRRYERELIEARAAAEQAQKRLAELNDTAQAVILTERETAALREQFIAVLGHDLRNPLAAIEAGMQLLSGKPSDEKAEAVIRMMRGSASRMAGLIDNVMDFARGRLGGGLAIDLSETDALAAVLQHVVAELQTSSPVRGIEASIALTEPVVCDTTRLGQLASNLLGNALTHGASDEPVRLSATTVGGWFELSVANSGEPIPEGILPTIFEPFSRGSLRPSLQGLGLGLYICSEIAKAHGGTLVVTSTMAETCFTFRMPLAGAAITDGR